MTIFEKRDYNDPRYKAWRKKIFARARGRCQMPNCNSGDKRLNAHHIKRWADFPALRFSPENGVALCRTHHDSVTDHEEEWEAVFRGVVGPGAAQDIVLQMIIDRFEARKNRRLMGGDEYESECE